MKNVIFTIMVAASATSAYAGFLDGIKKIGGGVVEAVGSTFDSAVNVTTNTVQSISASADVSAEPTQQFEADSKTLPSVNNSAKQDSVQAVSERKPTQYELEQERRKRNEEERERRYQAEQERQRVGREKYQAEQAAREKAEREERIAREKAARDEEDRKRAEQESRERIEREEAARRRAEEEKQRAEREKAEQEERDAREKARREQAAREEAERVKAEADRKAAEQAERDRIASEKAAMEKEKRDAVEKVHSTFANFHAKAAGNPEGYEFKPISVYRDVKLGMTIEEVCCALDIRDAQKFLREADEYSKWIRGKAQKVVLEKHTLFLQFAHISGDAINSSLVSAQMEFNDKDRAPTPAEVYEKYATILGVKSRKEKQKHGDKFKDDIPQFWKVVYWKVCGEIKNQKERYRNGWADPEDPSCKEFMVKLEADEKAIREDIVEDVFREVDIFDVDGMQICVKPKVETGKISIITFEDVVVSDFLVKFKADVKASKEKAAAEAKAEADKKAKSDTLNF